jgi:hypothetical protein
MAFTQNSDGTFVKQPRLAVQNFVQAVDVAGTFKTVVIAGPNGSKVTSIVVCSTDTVNAHVVTIAVNRSTVRYTLNSANVVINTGTNGIVAPIDLFSTAALPVDNDGQKYLFLESGDTLDATFATALNTAQALMLMAVYGDF